MNARRYGQACPVAHALDMIGDRWALLVVRELRLGPRRYLDLQGSLPGLSPSVLAQRLRDLEEVGVLRSRTITANTKAYELTEWGKELEPVFAALARWGMRSPVVPLQGALTDDAAMLGLRMAFNQSMGSSWSASYRIHLDRDTYYLQVDEGQLTQLVRDGRDQPVDATLTTTGKTLHALRTGTDSFTAARKARRLTIVGDVRAARQLLRAFTNRPASRPAGR